MKTNDRRYAISINGWLYWRLREYADRVMRTPTGIVEHEVNDWLDRRGWPRAGV